MEIQIINVMYKDLHKNHPRTVFTFGYKCQMFVGQTCFIKYLRGLKN